MCKYLRQYKDLFDAEGVTIEDVRTSNHYVFALRTKTGKKFKMTAPTTPSCRRGLLNFRGDLRRIVQNRA